MKAELHFRKAIQLDPKFIYSYWHLSKLLVDEARFDEAVEVYQSGMNGKNMNQVANESTVK